jgi:hypothetical protein
MDIDLLSNTFDVRTKRTDWNVWRWRNEWDYWKILFKEDMILDFMEDKDEYSSW